MEKREPAYTAGGNVNWRSDNGEQYESFLEKLKILKKTIIQKNPCTPMFTAALFTIARTCKQPKCPSTAKWIKKL